VALVLDGVDGVVARRSGTVSALGARFDMEVDAFLILVLSVYVSRLLGGWVLTIARCGYAFVAASRVLPWMRSALPPRYWRKVWRRRRGSSCGGGLGRAAPTLTLAAVVAALALLVESFGRDVRCSGTAVAQILNAGSLDRLDRLSHLFGSCSCPLAISRGVTDGLSLSAVVVDARGGQVLTEALSAIATAAGTALSRQWPRTRRPQPRTACPPRRSLPAPSAVWATLSVPAGCIAARSAR